MLTLNSIAINLKQKRKKNGSVFFNKQDILLLDEVSAHLDSKHFQALFDEALNYSSQIWMTGTDKNIFKKLDYSGKPQYFVINDSIITQPVDL